VGVQLIKVASSESATVTRKQPVEELLSDQHQPVPLGCRHGQPGTGLLDVPAVLASYAAVAAGPPPLRTTDFIVDDTEAQ